MILNYYKPHYGIIDILCERNYDMCFQLIRINLFLIEFLCILNT